MDQAPESVGAFEAKTHLSSLLDRVAGGEEFTITRHGKPVARLVPATDAAVDAGAVDVAFRRLDEHARVLARGASHEELRRFVDEGRL